MNDPHPELGHTLLERDEEKALADAMRWGVVLVAPMHDAAECHACQRADGPAAMLLAHNLQMAWHVAHSLAASPEEREEFYAEACAAMLAELHRFDPAKGRFGPFAFVVMRHAVSRFKTDNRPLSADTKMRRLEPRFARTRQRLTADLGRPPTRAELAAELGVSQTELELWVASWQTKDVHAFGGEDDDELIEVQPVEHFMEETSPARVVEVVREDIVRSAFVDQRGLPGTTVENEVIRLYEAGGEAWQLERLVDRWIEEARLTAIEAQAVDHWFGRHGALAAGTFAELGELIERDASNAHRALARAQEKIAGVMRAAGIESIEEIFTIEPPEAAERMRMA